MRRVTGRKVRRATVGKDELLHVETPLGIVNIRTGLTDRHGRRVDSVEIIPNRYAGEPKVLRRGLSNTRLVECKTVNA